MRTFLCLAVLVLVAGCGGEKLPESSANAELPEGHPDVSAEQTTAGGSGLGSDAPTDGDRLYPLKLEGSASLKEMEAGMMGTTDAEASGLYESGFRKTFAADASKRDYPGAAKDLESALELDPAYAEAHRALGYARFNMGFDVGAALDEYKKAIELKPDYGEAHYALAFLYAMSDLESGGTHFRKAMELGIGDEQNLGSRFYPN